MSALSFIWIVLVMFSVILIIYVAVGLVIGGVSPFSRNTKLCLVFLLVLSWQAGIFQSETEIWNTNSR